MSEDFPSYEELEIKLLNAESENQKLRDALIKIRNYHNNSSTKTYQGMEAIAMRTLEIWGSDANR